MSGREAQYGIENISYSITGVQTHLYEPIRFGIEEKKDQKVLSVRPPPLQSVRSMALSAMAVGYKWFYLFVYFMNSPRVSEMLVVRFSAVVHVYWTGLDPDKIVFGS